MAKLSRKSFHNSKASHLTLVIYVLNITAFGCVRTVVAEERRTPPLLLLVSFDGFRWDYLDVVKRAGRATPNFDRLVGNGATIGDGGLVNSFVTKTLPNHYTLVTGQYEENHGVIANWFFDPDFNETMAYGANSEDQKWWDGRTGGSGAGAEPVWVTNERAGGDRVSGSYFWAGSFVDNQRPTYSRRYDGTVNFTDRIDAVVRWFTSRETKPINLGTLYFEEPDLTGHRFGPNSTEVVEKIVEMDGVLGYLVRSLEEKKIFDRLNIIVTSDHGMTSITDFIYMDEIVDPSLYKRYGSSPVWNIQPKPGQTDAVYAALKRNKKLIVYRNIDIPEELHYKRNRRILEIVISAPEGYQLCPNRSMKCQMKGNHGYDNRLTSMHPIFIAHGPAFKKNYTAEPFRNVDVYPLMCKILRIVEHANDGSLEKVKSILVDDDDDNDYCGNDIDAMNCTFYTLVVAVGFALLVSVICFITVCSSQRIYFRRKRRATKRIGETSPSANKRPIFLMFEDGEEDFA